MIINFDMQTESLAKGCYQLHAVHMAVDNPHQQLSEKQEISDRLITSRFTLVKTHLLKIWFSDGQLNQRLQIMD